MSNKTKVLNALGRILVYPDDSTVQTAEFLFVALQGELDSAASLISKFGAYAEQQELWELEESYTRTFDINPTCALEVGWHLFGEEYERGMFLVRMREELKKHGLSESSELPDHIAHVLSVVAAMDDDDATWFVLACVLPAVEKMNQSLEGKEMPYQMVIQCLEDYLKHQWDKNSEAFAKRKQQVDPRSPSGSGDLLRAFPVADVDLAAEKTCSQQVQFVPLQINYPSTSTIKRKP